MAEDKIWPPYKPQYSELWDKVSEREVAVGIPPGPGRVSRPEERTMTSETKTIALTEAGFLVSDALFVDLV